MSDRPQGPGRLPGRRASRFAALIWLGLVMLLLQFGATRLNR